MLHHVTIQLYNDHNFQCDLWLHYRVKWRPKPNAYPIVEALASLASAQLTSYVAWSDAQERAIASY